MRRFQAFEFTDLAWWPNTFRMFLTDYLTTLLSIAKPYDVKVKEISKAILNSDHNSVIDLCSGSSGPWINIYQDIKNSLGSDFKLFLTDKFPNSNNQSMNHFENIKQVSTPIDATNVPGELKGVRTLFNSFHHFSKDQGNKILHDAIKNEEPIFIFEILHRSWLDIFILPLVVPLSVLTLTPLIRPFSWRRLFWTYIIPLAPLVIFWDTLISNMRCYNEKELISMAKNADKDNRFEWYSGVYRKNLLPVTYLYSVKKSPKTNCREY